MSTEGEPVFESDSPFQILGEIISADCTENPDEDFVAVAMVTQDGSPYGVLVESAQTVEPVEGKPTLLVTQILLSPRDGRRIASALLNAADAVDGTVPLNFKLSDKEPNQ